MKKDIMTHRILLLSLLVNLFIVSCDHDFSDQNPEKWIKGLWTSEQSDTLCFSSFLIINNSFPYDYDIHNDSLKIFPSWNSNFNWRTYKLEINKPADEIYIYGFLGYKKLILSRQTNDCKI